VHHRDIELPEQLGVADAGALQDLRRGNRPGAQLGENLQDHLEMYLQYECKEPVSLYPALQWWNQPKMY
jgi:choline dehydrogenase-like flavoprotein